MYTIVFRRKGWTPEVYYTEQMARFVCSLFNARVGEGYPPEARLLHGRQLTATWWED
jgi:hypothetical protein